MRLLVLLTDAFGGHGGIAKFNRDLLNALCAYPKTTEVTALPRTITEDPGLLPDCLIYLTPASRGKAAYVYHLGQLLARRKTFDAILCGHLHLLPLAALAASRYEAPLTLIVHGIEAWQKPRVLGLQRSLPSVNAFVSVSRLTKERFLEWAPFGEEQGHVIPDCVDLAKFGPGPKPAGLLQRYGLSGRRVIMTLGRLSAAERYKGIDEVLAVMPSLITEMPDLMYLILGDGDDRLRLQEKARTLGLDQHVKFGGFIPEEQKADHLRLADAFVMPGRGEGFGIVYLEAMACGIPVVASKADASREAVLDGQLGLLADPSNPQEIRTAIKEALRRPRGVQRELEYFSLDRFVERCHALLDENLLCPSSQRRGVCAERSEGADGVARSASPIGRSPNRGSAKTSAELS